MFGDFRYEVTSRLASTDTVFVWRLTVAKRTKCLARLEAVKIT